MALLQYNIFVVMQQNATLQILLNSRIAKYLQLTNILLSKWNGMVQGFHYNSLPPLQKGTIKNRGTLIYKLKQKRKSNKTNKFKLQTIVFKSNHLKQMLWNRNSGYLVGYLVLKNMNHWVRKGNVNYCSLWLVIKELGNTISLIPLVKSDI